jgi:GGDEF domain-containing protein
VNPEFAVPRTGTVEELTGAHLSHFYSAEELATTVQPICAFNQPLHTLAGNIPVSASIGIHVATDDDDYESLLRAADGAMYDAKRSGPGRIRYSLTRLVLDWPIEALD